MHDCRTYAASTFSANPATTSISDASAPSRVNAVSGLAAPSDASNTSDAVILGALQHGQTHAARSLEEDAPSRRR